MVVVGRLVANTLLNLVGLIVVIGVVLGDVLELGVKIGLIIGLVVYLVLVIGLRDVGIVPVRREPAFLAALAIRLGRCCAVGKGRSLLRLAAFSAVVVALCGLPIASV